MMSSVVVTPGPSSSLYIVRRSFGLIRGIVPANAAFTNVSEISEYNFPRIPKPADFLRTVGF